MKFQLVRKLIAVTLSFSVLTGFTTSSVFAAAHAANKPRLATTISAAKLTATLVNDNEVHFTVVNGGHNIEAVVTKDKQFVTSTFYLDKKIIQTDKRDLEKATARGEMVKKDSALLPTPDAGHKVSPPGAQYVPDPGGGGGIPSGDYYFDSVVYSPRSQYQPYAHPDKNYYGISPYTTWEGWGSQNKHIQVNQYDSNSIIQMPAWAIGGGLGALVGGLWSGNLTGSVIGAIIGGALGAFFGGQATRILDENGCIWLVMDRNPPLVNLGPWWYPMWYINVRYVAVGPFSTTDYYYPLS